MNHSANRPDKDAGSGEPVGVFRVECYSGGAYAERPAALHWQGKRLEIVEIMRRWRNPAGRGFHVQTDDGRTFELFYHEVEDRWEVTP